MTGARACLHAHNSHVRVTNYPLRPSCRENPAAVSLSLLLANNERALDERGPRG